MSLDMSSREALERSLGGLHLQLASKAGSVDMRTPRQKKAVWPTFLLTENINQGLKKTPSLLTGKVTFVKGNLHVLGTCQD
jgi:hypothetical protein